MSRTVMLTKRMAQERKDLEEASNQDTDQDYFVFFQDDNLLQFDAYVIAPDTIYRYRLVKLHFDIPDYYPREPPKVRFIQYRGGRVHPNLYPDGKVCLSILGTWHGEPWVDGMTCHAVLITIRSLLDDEPFKHEPVAAGVNNPGFNNYVEYNTWKWLLLDHVLMETNPQAKAWLDKYLVKNGQAMLRELARQQEEASASNRMSVKPAHDAYRWRQVPTTLNYPLVMTCLEAAVSAATSRLANRPAHSPSSQSALKRKAGHQQPSTTGGGPEDGDGEDTEKKRAKLSASPKP